MTRTVLAVDIGSTKIAAAVVGEDGGVLRTATRPTPTGPDGEEVFAALLAAIDASQPDGVIACGVGTIGPMTLHGERVMPLNTPGWRGGFPLLARLRGALAMPVTIDNDAKALAVGEAWKGAGRGARSFLAMVVSTGVGGGLVVDGRLLHGAQGNAGHVGHVVVVPGGSPCGCGGRGCLEAEISGTGIRRRTGRDARDAGPSEVRRAGRLLGEALASVVNLLDLELVAVGGSVALGFGEPFFAAANEAFSATSRLEFARGARIVPVGLGPQAPLVGAAALAWRALGADVGVR